MAQWKRVGLRILMGVKLSKGCKFESCCGRSFTFLSIFPFFHRILIFFIHFLHFFIKFFHVFDINIFFPTKIRCKIGLLYLFVIMPNKHQTLSGFSKFVPFIPLLFHSLLLFSFYTHSLCLKINY